MMDLCFYTAKTKPMQTFSGSHRIGVTDHLSSYIALAKVCAYFLFPVKKAYVKPHFSI